MTSHRSTVWICGMNLSMNINILILQSTKFSILTPTPTLLHAARVTPMSDHVYAVFRTLP